MSGKRFYPKKSRTDIGNAAVPCALFGGPLRRLSLLDLNSGWSSHGNSPPSWDIRLGLGSFLLVQKLVVPRNQVISVPFELIPTGTAVYLRP